MSSRCVWPARLVNRPFSTANDVGGRINSVAEAVDHLAVQFGLPGCQNIQADYFCKIAKKFDVINEIEKESWSSADQILTCLGKCRIAPDQHQHSTQAAFASSSAFVVTWDADAKLLWWRRKKKEKLNLDQTDKYT